MDNDKKNPEPAENIVFEDLVQYANQYTQGAHPTGRNSDGKKLTVLDLLRVDADDNSKASNILPYEMSTFMDTLGNAYVNLVEIQQMIATAYKSSLTKDTKKIRKGLGLLNKNIQQQKKMIKDCGKIIDKLSH